MHQLLLCLPPMTYITECTHPSTERALREKVGDTREESREVVGGTSENYEILIYYTIKRSCYCCWGFSFFLFVSFQSLNMDPVQLTGLHHFLNTAREIKRIGINHITI